MRIAIAPECTVSGKHPLIVCAEKGRKIVFHNPNRRIVTRHTVDNCKAFRDSLEKQCKLCDFLVIDWRNDEHYVELKGSNVEHALEQLISTISIFHPEMGSCPIYCWIITTESPRILSKVQNLKYKLEKKLGIRIVIRTDKYEHYFEKIVK